MENLINQISIKSIQNFFRRKSDSFSPANQDYSHFISEDSSGYISELTYLGSIEFENAEELIIIAGRWENQLTERTSKLRQYKIAKDILRSENKDASIFIFYDDNGNFRFSFITAQYSGTKRQFTTYKRYTYFVSPKLTNKTFRMQIGKCEFDSLRSIQEAFNVEPVTKQFYEKLQRWYFWALNKTKFPNDAEEEPNGRENAIIRLITRLMFIWFMKVRGLIPNELFDENKIREILKDISPQESTYYKAILQNLFFATLNTKQEERKFRSDKRGPKGYNTDFGNPNVYRYHYLFKEPEKLESLFGAIPFLNGGLFECLDYKTKDKDERKYIDGFTDTKKQQPIVPNFLFFSGVNNVDISSFFGQENKTYEVEGLINLLNSYNFTIDENEPDDIEVALDPELLGSIFENLLASYNPETATTARKATGSFYTPREIVNYMTEESLKQYFKTHLSGNEKLDKNLETLLNTNNSENPFDENTTIQIIELINNLRVVDPAVGSGAFPMAMLNKLVFILGKLDPENKYWKQSQIEGVKKSVSDPALQRRLIEQIEKKFNEKNADYGRKLYLIEKCIYGVDIQQIAVEIAKLRFFISLLVDEKIDFDKPGNNYGIEPLPNLDFKLMQGNSLISTFAGIDFSNEKEKENNLFADIDEPYKILIKEFEELKHEYQNETDPQAKKDLRAKIDKAIINIFEVKIREHFPELQRIEEDAKRFPKKAQQTEYIKSKKQKLTKKLGFDIEQIEKDLIAYTEGRKPKDFFLWNVYFAEVFSEKQGFDIVIGNPPYIQLQKAFDSKRKFADLYKNENFVTFERTGDIYALFYEKGINVLAEKGILCYITSNKWMRANYGKALRKFLSEYNPLVLIDLGPGIFNSATVDTNILLVQKIRELVANNKFPNLQMTSLKAITLKKGDKINDLPEDRFVALNNLSEESWIILTPEEQKIKEKIERIGTPLKDWDISINYGIKTGYNEAFIIDGKTKDKLIAEDPKSAEIIKPILRGRDIKRYKSEFADKWLINSHNGYVDSNGNRIPPIDINNYPAIKKHLDQYWDKIKIRQDKGKTPYNLRNCAYLEEFEKEKIVYNDISRQLSFSLCDKGIYFNNTVYFITYSKFNKYFLSILNSNVINWFYKRTSAQLGSEAIRLFSIYVINLPVPQIPKEKQKPFEELVNKIIAKEEKGEDTTAEEFQIDLLVYKLYELTYEEVKIVDPEFPLTEEEYKSFVH